MIILNTYDQIKELPGYMVALLFFTPLFGGIIWYSYKTRHARLWRKGILPPALKFNQDNLLEAYLAMGASLILLDYKNYRGKTQFINQYFNRYFRAANYDFGDSLIFSMRHPLKIETACAWLNMHLRKEGERSQVIYFLTGLALINGSLNRRELAFLTIVNRELGLTEDNLRRIITIYESYYSAKAEEAQKNQRHKAHTHRTDRLKQFRTILGVSENAGADDIKKAYRKLVKQHHPDAFAGASDAQKRMAEDTFIQIQEAYEALSKSA